MLWTLGRVSFFSVLVSSLLFHSFLIFGGNVHSISLKKLCSCDHSILGVHEIHEHSDDAQSSHFCPKHKQKKQLESTHIAMQPVSLICSFRFFPSGHTIVFILQTNDLKPIQYVNPTPHRPPRYAL
jgi:hypothetical protein